MRDMGNEAAAAEAMDLDKKREESPSEDAKKDAPPPSPPKVVDLLCQNVFLLEEAVHAKETHLCMGRLLRQTAAVRKKMTESDVLKLLRTKIPNSDAIEKVLNDFLDFTAAASEMETDENEGKENMTNGKSSAAEAKDAGASGSSDPQETKQEKPEPAPYARVARASAVPECETYVFLLATMKLLDAEAFDKAKDLTTMVVDRLQSYNRRTMDSLAARVYSYYSWSHEKCGDDCLKSIRSNLLSLQRTAILRHDEVGQETLLNLLLHNYLHFSLYDHAEKLRSKTQVSPNHRNMHQFCRYLYYVGRIRAIQLDYTESKESLQQALRKVPAGAKGFRIILHKWLCMVSLLLGEIPERTHFTVPGMRRALKPYFKLTQAIR